VLSDIGTPSSLDVQQIADQRHAIGAFGVGLAPSASESPPEGRDFELEPGSIPVAGDCGDRNSMGRAYCREPPALFFGANTARQLVGISVGIGSNRR
jgi:hypothetical protein